ncbi:hypothetical protein [Staphylococcus capitis]|uniref:hypothetical protein n=1 Tax=Staphylococcus capitis TaxID=29388 RepID=UPI002DBBC046|nr:hypothetical protein [Staphylococcus capitis]MEB5628481.1 hypothetical protein [Staphylococcus capitis]
MNYENTVKLLSKGTHTYTLDKDVSAKDKEEVLISDQPLNIVYGVCTGEYEIQDLSNKKDIAAIDIKGTKGKKYIAVFKGDYNIRIAELDSKGNTYKLYKW